MPRVMLIGAGPLPRASSTQVPQGALRTRQLFDALLEAGLTVNLFTIPIAGGPPTPDAAVPAMLPDTFEGLTHQRFTALDSEFAIRALSEQVRQLQPDALVGVGSYPAYLAAMLPTTLPLWADFHTHSMSEAQGRGFTEMTEDHLPDAWAIERALVRRIDKFSAITRPLLHAILGELAAVGRFNQYTYHYQFGHHLPVAAWRWPTGGGNTGEKPEPVLRGPIVPTDAFVILWNGSFESWSDPATLVHAMNDMLSRQPNVHCVMTGPPRMGHARGAQQVFDDHVEQSMFKDRFHQLGAVDFEKLAHIIREADIGVVLDGRNYESLFGAHWRLATMASERLAIAATPATELAEWLEDAHALLPVGIGDAEGLVDAIEPWIDQREHLQTIGNKAHRFMHDHANPAELASKLVSWLRDPKLAPDNHAKRELDGTVVTDLNTVALNGCEEQTMMLARYQPHEIQQALADWENRTTKSKPRFTFGLRRG